MSSSLWDTLKQSFRSWTGMILPETMRGLALEQLGRLAEPTGLSSQAYVHELGHRPEQRQALLDRLGLGTTWFMRDQPGLRSLMDALVTNTPRDQPIWIWSVGCSSGEEPYSLAMAMIENGLTARILATDLNRDALRRAERGCYPARAVSRLPDEWQRRYFNAIKRGWVQIDEAIRRMVTFTVHNFVETPDIPTGWHRFNAV
ncbi:MAG: CheR family methyltransferase, partial [Myxococcota bacterium]